MSAEQGGEGSAYVRRDVAGGVLSVSREALADHPERLPLDHPDVTEFAQQLSPRRTALLESDLSLIRALEDLIDVLIQKDVLRLTDLPESVQAKLATRRQLRGSLKSLHLLGDEHDSI